MMTMTEERREEAEKIAVNIVAPFEYAVLIGGDANMMIAAITSALLEAEERGARRERQEWRAAVQHFSVVINAVAMTSSPEELRSFIAALPDTFPVPKSCVTDEEIRAATEEARKIRPEIERDRQEWQPIETAPKDGRLIDVWCVNPYDDDDIRPIRLTDVAWNEADEIFPHSGWVRVTDDGHWDLVEGPPLGPLGLPAWKPTHWRPLPTPPKEAPDV